MAIFPKGSKSRGTPNFSLDLSSHLPSIPKKSSPVPITGPLGNERAPVTDSFTDVYPLNSPAIEDVPLWNILPSYQLFLSTFSKNMNPLTEDYVAEPPTYEEPSPNLSESDNSDSDYFGLNPRATQDRRQSATDITRWENTISANTHRLKRLSNVNKSLSDNLKIDIVLTKSPGQKDKKPVIYDPLTIEFAQGDSIHGFVTVRNTHSARVTFDMFSVIFEGRIAVNSNEGDSNLKPILFYKFLNMFDYFASWTPAYFEGTSPGLPTCIDSVDGSTLFFPNERYLDPGVVYKKFFNFTIPDTLLDCACEVHDIPAHCKIIPSIGLNKDVFLQRLRKMRLAPSKPEKATFSISQSSNSKQSPLPSSKKGSNIIFKDFSFSDTSISYSVEARMIGKLSAYDGKTAQANDEFIMLMEASSPLRIIPRHQEADEVNNESVAEKHYEAFRKTIQKAIDLGKRLDEGKDDPKLPQRRSSVAKQTYHHNPASPFPKPENPETYEVHLPYKKKTLTQPVKVAGMMKAVFSRREHVLQYLPPPSFKPSVLKETRHQTQTKIPISLMFKSVDAKGCRPPEIKSVTGKLMICTVRTKKYPIPLQLTQDMKFQNSLAHNDSIERYVNAPFAKYLVELTKYIGKYGQDLMNINQQTIMDVKCLANLELKTNNLKIDALGIKTAGGLAHWQEKDKSKGEYTKELELLVDLKSLFPKDLKSLSDEIRSMLSLVPSFESCLVCRYYYIHIDIKLYNGDTLPVRVPVTLRK